MSITFALTDNHTHTHTHTLDTHTHLLDLHALDATVHLKVPLDLALTCARSVEIDHKQGG